MLLLLLLLLSNEIEGKLTQDPFSCGMPARHTSLKFWLFFVFLIDTNSEMDR